MVENKAKIFTVQKTKTMWTVWRKVVAMNNIITKIPIFEMDFDKISSLYGWRKHPLSGVRSFHYGIDYPDAFRTPIYSVKAGSVYISKMQSNGRGLGNYIVLNHDEDYSLYAHLDERVVEQGETVTQGQLIGYMGTTGDSTGVHLHFGMCESYNVLSFNNSSWFNPLPVLKAGVVSKEFKVDGVIKRANSILIANQNYVRVQDLEDTLKIAEVGYSDKPIIND